MTTDFTLEELQSATRNHGMPLEGLAYATTPVGMHYVLTHFDIPRVDAATWRLEVDGRVDRTLSLSLEELRARPRVTQPVTLECAGNGRARLEPRPHSQPWLDEAVGTGEWIGTPLGPLLQDAGLLDDAKEVLFTGLDRGEQGGIVQWYQRALSAADCLRPEVLLAYEMNGEPLPPQHGFPLRLIVPGWYGMTQVKWLHRITVLDEPFWGYQQNVFYRIAQHEDDPGVQLSRMYPRALMVPPGMPVFETRERLLPPGHHPLQGRAWSGWGSIDRVEVSTDAGQHWQAAALEPPTAPHVWQAWSLDWEADEGRHELLCRATDAAGNVQPLVPQWNLKGVANNAVQRLVVQVRRELAPAP
ncbi:sulfite oxidase [Halomonas sp. M4R1S46]|uniref:sulfite oxidase n=1 Tax=Halomonas sp. M4R1S46 TaxID=2982692 RepID=UPI0021E43692|nr:sulfite oxidase [Halomonas sp. M4R1S46]UYG06963.1 sulfite oxidase [Halomonas sp. M4R1S46]